MKIEEFWAKKEKEIHEKVIYKCLVQYMSGYRNLSGPLWGLFFFTKEAIYFQNFPKKNWFSSILNMDTESSEKLQINFRISWKEITKITFPKKKSKIISLFSPSGHLIIVDYVNYKENYSLHLLFNNSIDVLKNFVEEKGIILNTIY